MAFITWKFNLPICFFVFFSIFFFHLGFTYLACVQMLNWFSNYWKVTISTPVRQQANDKSKLHRCHKCVQFDKKKVFFSRWFDPCATTSTTTSSLFPALEVSSSRRAATGFLPPSLICSNLNKRPVECCRIDNWYLSSQGFGETQIHHASFLKVGHTLRNVTFNSL